MKNKFGFDLVKGARVRVAHPRGGHNDTRVRGFERMPGYGWRVLACGINWEDSELICAHTGKRIPSAYAEDKTEEE